MPDIQQDLTLRVAIIDAYARSISMIWIVMTPIVGVSFLLGRLLTPRWNECTNSATVLFVRKYTLHRTIVQAAKSPSSDSGQAEKGDAGKEMQSTSMEKQEERTTVEKVADREDVGSEPSPRAIQLSS